MIQSILMWIYTAMGLIACWFVLKKKRVGWLIWLAATPIMVAYAILTKAWGFVVVFIAYGFLDVKGWIDWGREAREKKKEDKGIPWNKYKSW